MHRPLHRLATAALIALGLMIVAAPAVASGRGAARKAESAWKNGDFEAVVRIADEALAQEDTAEMRFFKARGLWALGKHEKAWELMTSFSPASLPKSYQDKFVVEYERMEKQLAKERSAGRKVKHMQASLARHRGSERLRGQVSTAFWVGAGAGLLLGCGLAAYGIMSHGDADTAADRDTALYLTAAGALIAGGGGGFAIAAFAVSPDGPVMPASDATPRTVPGLAFSGRF